METFVLFYKEIYDSFKKNQDTDSTKKIKVVKKFQVLFTRR